MSSSSVVSDRDRNNDQKSKSSDAPSTTQQPQQDGQLLPTVLRFVHINDCYELANLPRLATAIREVRAFASGVCLIGI